MRVLTSVLFVQHLESNSEVSVQKGSFLDVDVIEQSGPLALVHLAQGPEQGIESLFLRHREVSRGCDLL